MNPQSIPLPPGASESTAISLAKPAKTPELLEVLLFWRINSVPKTLLECYTDDNSRSIYYESLKEAPEAIASLEKSYIDNCKKDVKELEECFNAHDLTLVLHNSQAIHNGKVVDVTNMKKQISLYQSSKFRHFALATLDNRTQSMTQALAQLFVMFSPNFTLTEKPEIQ